MADVKSTGKYDYMKPDDNNERRKKVETAGNKEKHFYKSYKCSKKRYNFKYRIS